MESITLKPIEIRLMEECAEDWAGLWSFIWSVREEMGVSDPAERRKATMEIVSRLLAAGLIRAGDIADEGFRPSSESSEEVLERIEREWDSMDGEPTIGDIVWFDLTEEGEEYVRKLDGAA